MNIVKKDIIDEIEDIKLDIKSMIPEYNVIVVVTNEGYVKKVNMKSYSSVKDEPTTLKPGDYVKGLYSTTTLNTLLVFTNLGRYLYVPVHIIPETKWKELGKHISNVIPLDQDEKVIGSYMIGDKNEEIVLFTKNGQIKKTLIKDLEVTRYSKPLTAIKLKDDDELITVKKSTDQVILITKHGYYLRYNSLEIPLVGPKASGVKGINLKDDEVVFGGTIDIDDIYLNIFTNNKTAKRLKTESTKYTTVYPFNENDSEGNKVTDLDIASRAKRGSTLIKKTKTVNYEITHVLLTNSKDEICIKSDSEIKNLKNSDIPIMDISSTGSAISKYNIDDAFKVTSLKTFMNNKEENDTKEEVIEKTDTQVKQQSLDDFIEDFKL